MAFKVRRRTLIKGMPQDLAVPVSGRSGGVGVNIRSLQLSDESKRKEAQVSKEQLETLYRIDGLTFRIVQKYIEKMVGAGYVLKEGSERGRGLCEKFCKAIDIEYHASEIIRDIFITGAGTAWTELGYTEAGTNIVTMKMINPKSGIDFLRDKDGDILYDDHLKPLGYKLGGNLGYPKMVWKEDSIVVHEEAVWAPKKPGDDGRDRIAYWKLVGTGTEEGMSPLEPSYKASLVRMNLEDTVGNAAFRSLIVAALVGDEDQPAMSVTDAQLNSVRDKLRDLDQDTVWSFRRNVKLVDVPTPDVSNYEKLMYYFADLATSGSGIGLALILQPVDRGYRGDIEIKQEEFMESVSLFQDRLSFQVRENIFKRLLKARGQRPENAPIIHFRGKESGIALSTSRRLSTYARYKLITPDPVLEAFIRDQEGLPAKPIETQETETDEE